MYPCNPSAPLKSRICSSWGSGGHAVQTFLSGEYGGKLHIQDTTRWGHLISCALGQYPSGLRCCTVFSWWWSLGHCSFFCPRKEVGVTVFDVMS